MNVSPKEVEAIVAERDDPEIVSVKSCLTCRQVLDHGFCDLCGEYFTDREAHVVRRIAKKRGLS